ncbi:nitrilase-related carbon-nitrogen hydrolase [Pseudoalteromonas denitrificans]|uniref:Carbon-nitrogen hydrolase n=1 Tax=Pseudoalteromonas denitrificans DSM 6059 TaxID=1123010 RepID=A0A1I1SP08_9GAMM|nr:nitrilase-related carbon-nitrogen hydrolase [Pseudoalteromonas denitrificans]SFD48209.1 Carbon-nitrogen hydrolase [Pseudoalteromonas denitrificans DSM 6059]
MIKLSAIQLCSVPDVDENLQLIEQYINELLQIDTGNKHIILLPECCLFFGGKETDQLILAQKVNNNNRLINLLSHLAKKYQVTLVAGTIPLLTDCGEKFFNASCVFSPKGELIGR